LVRVASYVLGLALSVPLGGCAAGPDERSSHGLTTVTSSPTEDEPYQPTAFLATIETEGDAFRPAAEDAVRRPPTAAGDVGRYTVDDGAGLPTAKVVASDDPVFRPTVLEQVRLGIDDAPVINTLEDTFVRHDGTWLLGAESVRGKYHDEHEPQSRSWAGSAPLAVARAGDLAVVVDADQVGTARD